MTRGIFRIFTLLILAAASILSSCATFRPHEAESRVNVAAGSRAENDNLSEVQKILVAEAYRILGAERLFVNGKSFSMDCSGTVMAIYWAAGIDLSRAFSGYTGGGTERIYKYLDDKGLLYRTKIPAPGDIIFWDNTYDKNKNGKNDDYLTHMGMVVTVGENGSIEYIHENYRKGIVLARMNLLKPDTWFEIVKGKKIILNDPMRMKGSPRTDGAWLSSQLYRDFGMAYLLK